MWDTDGNKYLDLCAGIAVNALGHNDEQFVKVSYPHEFFFAPLSAADLADFGWNKCVYVHDRVFSRKLPCELSLMSIRLITPTLAKVGSTLVPLY